MTSKSSMKGDIVKAKAGVTKGLSLFETLGIGGMSTRGMGRLRILNLKDSANHPKGATL